LRQWIAETTIAHEKSGGTDTRYVDAAKASTSNDASTSVAEWKRSWGVIDDAAGDGNAGAGGGGGGDGGDYNGGAADATKTTQSNN
jgi:hypothetical protein